MVEELVAGSEHGLRLLVALGEVLLNVVEEFLDHPMGLAHGDDVVAPPEELHLADADGLVVAVEIGEMEDEEIVVVVLVDFGPLGGAAAVLDVKGVEMIVV